MNLQWAKLCRIVVLTALSLLIGLTATAQATAAAKSAPGTDLYFGYAFLGTAKSDIYYSKYGPAPGGIVGSGDLYFSHSFGVQAEYSTFWGSNYCFHTLEFGPAFRHQFKWVNPFVYSILGAAWVSPSYQNNGRCTLGWATAATLGADFAPRRLHLPNHVAFRSEGTFQFTDVNFGPQPVHNTLVGGVGKITAYRVSAGLVYHIGAVPLPAHPAAFGCEAQPVTVYPGDPIAVTGRVINLQEDKKHPPVYAWSSSGGRIAGDAQGATIATGGMAAGDYTVTGRVSEGSGPAQHAECSASFRVVAYDPPTISCSANPSDIAPGGFATITAVARSPQNRALTYSYGTTAGQITYSGANATLSTADVSPGPLRIACNVVDDLGNAASATVEIAVSAPPPSLPLPSTPSRAIETMCSVSFDRDREHPAQVDNEAKVCLEEIGLRLIRDSDATLVVLGNHVPEETPDMAAERALNVKQYLTDEMGINPNRIELRTGEVTGRRVDNFLVPPGASWDPAGTSSFDPSRIERHGQAYTPNL